MTAPLNVALPASCGGESRGVCHSTPHQSTFLSSPGICICHSNWTGPNCLNTGGYDDIVWDFPDTWSDLGFTWPSLNDDAAGRGMILVGGMVVLVLLAPLALMRRRSHRRRRQREGYKEVGNVRPTTQMVYEQS